MRIGIIRFPASGGAQDVLYALGLMGIDAKYVWHELEDRSAETAEKSAGFELDRFDALIIPGGSSFGDYVRPGAIAAHSPVMQAVKAYAAAGGRVLGIGNGFQVLCEAGLLPGTLAQNKSLKFVGCDVALRIDATCDFFALEAGEVVDLPLAAGFARYYCDNETLAALQAGKQIVLRYSTELGDDMDAEATEKLGVGSLDNIAGICNEARNVVGLMAHPERAVEDFSGSTEGRAFFNFAATTSAIGGAS